MVGECKGNVHVPHSAGAGCAAEVRVASLAGLDPRLREGDETLTFFLVGGCPPDSQTWKVSDQLVQFLQGSGQ